MAFLANLDCGIRVNAIQPGQTNRPELHLHVHQKAKFVHVANGANGVQEWDA